MRLLRSKAPGARIDDSMNSSWALLGQLAAERLAVDVHGLPLAVVVLDRVRHQVGVLLGHVVAPQVVGLDDVRVAGVGPDLVHARQL